MFHKDGYGLDGQKCAHAVSGFSLNGGKKGYDNNG